MARIKKKTPKNSGKKGKKKKSVKENIIVISIFLFFVVVAAALYYFLEIAPADEDVVALVNGKPITKEELNWWYTASIVPEYMDVITKQDFLVLSLIPQEILIQEAKKEGIIVSGEEVEQLLGIFIIENGFTLNQFEEHLKTMGITLEEITKSFESRAIIMELLDKKNITFADEDEFFTEVSDNSFEVYLNDLINNSEIKVFVENIEKFELKHFEETGDDICGGEKPIIRIYTTTSCEICDDSGKVFKELVKEFVGDGSIDTAHWNLDTGDNLLTIQKENGVPSSEVALFKEYSPNRLVPTIVMGCKYKLIGKLGSEEEEEFKKILLKLIAGE